MQKAATYFKELFKNRQKVSLLLAAILSIGFVVRLLFFESGIYQNDLRLLVSWGEALWQGGFADFYPSGIWNDRLPGIFYLLWPLAALKHIFPFVPDELLYKIPANLADTLIAWILFQNISKSSGQKMGVAAALLYAFNPFTWHISAFWGQVDAVQALLIVLVITLLLRKNYFFSSALLSFAVLFKPHSMFIAPLLFLFAWLHREGSITRFTKHAGTIIFAALASTWLLALPFATTRISLQRPLSLFGEPFILLWERFLIQANEYSYASVNAFNLWVALEKNWHPDALTFFRIPYQHWGLGLFLLFSSIFLFFLWKRSSTRFSANYYAAAAALSLFAFTFLVRAHERHIYPFFALFSFGMLSQKAHILVYILMSTAALLNSLYVMEHIVLGKEWIQAIALTPVVVSIYLVIVAAAKKDET